MIFDTAKLAIYAGAAIVVGVLAYKAYDAIGTDSLGEMLQAAQTAQLTHPVPVIRAREIDRWASSVEYQTILDKRESANGKKLGWSNW